MATLSRQPGDHPRRHSTPDLWELLSTAIPTGRQHRAVGAALYTNGQVAQESRAQLRVVEVLPQQGSSAEIRLAAR